MRREEARKRGYRDPKTAEPYREADGGRQIEMSVRSGLLPAALPAFDDRRPGCTVSAHPVALLAIECIRSLAARRLTKSHRGVMLFGPFCRAFSRSSLDRFNVGAQSLSGRGGSDSGEVSRPGLEPGTL